MRHAPSELQRHRALASTSRSRLLAVLRAAPGPLAIRELADAIDLHPNTAREHLDRLVDAGLVRRATGAPSGRGRPGLRYSAVRTAEDDAQAYHALAGLLAAELARRPDGHATSRAAGERWGGALVRDAGARLVRSSADPIASLVTILDDAGFAPAPGPDGSAMHLHRCPFGTLARESTDVVCNVHLGLMRGALRELGAPLEAVKLEPMVEPDLCVAYLAERGPREFAS